MPFASRLFLPALAALALCAACSEQPEPPADLDIEGGWVRATPGGNDVTAAYLTLVNTGGTDRLTGVSSDQLDRVEMHSSAVDENGVMRMTELDAVELGAGETVVFAPGSDHLMLYGAAGLALGDTVCLTLELERADDRIACLPVMDDAPLTRP